MRGSILGKYSQGTRKGPPPQRKGTPQRKGHAKGRKAREKARKGAKRHAKGPKRQTAEIASNNGVLAHFRGSKRQKSRQTAEKAANGRIHGLGVFEGAAARKLNHLGARRKG